MAALCLALLPARWPFNSAAPPRDASLWQLLLADRMTLGFVRLSVVFLSLFVIASIPALLAARRWLRSIGSTGVSADEADPGDLLAALAAVEERLGRLSAEREELQTLFVETASAAMRAAHDLVSHNDGEQR